MSMHTFRAAAECPKTPNRKMRTKMVERQIERAKEEEERAFCLHNFASIARLGIGMQQELAMWRGKSGSFALWVLVGCSADCLAGWLVGWCGANPISSALSKLFDPLK